MGAGRVEVSNLSIEGAFVAIVSGLQPGDGFSFELDLYGDEDVPVRGRAVVVWADPGIGVGVHFDLSAGERGRLAEYLEQTGLPRPAEPPRPKPGEEVYNPARRVRRRTVALGPDTPGESTQVWLKYLPGDEPAD